MDTLPITQGNLLELDEVFDGLFVQLEVEMNRVFRGRFEELDSLMKGSKLFQVNLVKIVMGHFFQRLNLEINVLMNNPKEVSLLIDQSMDAIQLLIEAQRKSQ